VNKYKERESENSASKAHKDARKNHESFLSTIKHLELSPDLVYSISESNGEFIFVGFYWKEKGNNFGHSLSFHTNMTDFENTLRNLVAHFIHKGFIKDLRKIPKPEERYKEYRFA